MIVVADADPFGNHRIGADIDVVRRGDGAAAAYGYSITDKEFPARACGEVRGAADFDVVRQREHGPRGGNDANPPADADTLSDVDSGPHAFPGRSRPVDQLLHTSVNDASHNPKPMPRH